MLCEQKSTFDYYVNAQGRLVLFLAPSSPHFLYYASNTVDY
jgi:hypothetical protein